MSVGIGLDAGEAVPVEGGYRADHRILHVEIRPPGIRPQQRAMLNPLRSELGLQLAAGKRLIDEFGGNPLQEVELAVGEREPRRLSLLDHRYFDAFRNRQLSALERRRDFPGVGGNRAGRSVRGLAVARVRDEHDLRAPLVLAEHVRSRADRMRADVNAICGDDFACDGRGVRHREHVQETQVRLRQADAQRMAIEDFEAGNRRVVVELAGLRRALAHGVRADDLALDEPQPRTLHRGVEEAPDRIFLIGGDQLSRLAAERGVGREENSLPEPERVRRAAVAHLGHRLERSRDELHGTREIVVGQHRVEDVVDDAVGRGVR